MPKLVETDIEDNAILKNWGTGARGIASRGRIPPPGNRSAGFYPFRRPTS